MLDFRLLQFRCPGVAEHMAKSLNGIFFSTFRVRRVGRIPTAVVMAHVQAANYGGAAP